ncbi:MAG TPA: RsiV family protein [Gammaproteobacteria bacterium]|nr:RsiV family protein [Gammaproteobacteria bacterium]
MKKLIIYFLTAFFAAQCSFAESIDGNASGFDITPSGSAAIVPPPSAEKEIQKIVIINEKMQIVATQKHEENSELPYTIDLTYPQIAGENISPQAKKFNELVTDIVNKNVQQFKNYVKADMPHMQTLPDSVKQNSLKMSYDIDMIKPAKTVLITVRLVIEGMQAGRAHPYHTHQVLNFDLNNGKILTLGNLFKPHTNYLNMFSKYSSKELNAKLQDKWMIKEGTAPLAKNYQQWNLKDKGILITFEEYQVAPYFAGKQEVEIPYSKLKNLAPLVAGCVKGCG